jgi:DNA-binding MurR/RpiR family transcriptional regulator
MQKYAVEMVALAPDVILADSSAAVAPLLQATQTISITSMEMSSRFAKFAICDAISDALFKKSLPHRDTQLKKLEALASHCTNFHVTRP